MSATSRIINRRDRKPGTEVVHIHDCESCGGVGHGEGAVFFSAGRTRAVTCDDCHGTGEVQDPECHCPPCLALWRQVLVTEPDADIAEWVADRERDNAAAVKAAEARALDEAERLSDATFEARMSVNP